MAMPASPPEVIWMRVGDEDGYHAFDAVEDAAEYLGEFYSIAAVERGPRFGVTTDGFTGLNYISMFWGLDDGDASAIRELADDELNELNESLDSIEWCRAVGEHE
jgi:hypothetical protein